MCGLHTFRPFDPMVRWAWAQHTSSSRGWLRRTQGQAPRPRRRQWWDDDDDDVEGVGFCEIVPPPSPPRHQGRSAAGGMPSIALQAHLLRVTEEVRAAQLALAAQHAAQPRWPSAVPPQVVESSVRKSASDLASSDGVEHILELGSECVDQHILEAGERTSTSASLPRPPSWQQMLAAALATTPSASA